MKREKESVQVNGRTYRWPSVPVVVVCIDGCSPAYLERGLAAGLMPNLARFQKEGFFAWADGVIPSFTNPNNLSIVTGTPPAVHGISGNYYLDPQRGVEIMMNDPRLLRCGTILAAFAREGSRIAVVTAKDKLLGLLTHDLSTGIRFSAERADRCSLPENGIEGVLSLAGMELPGVYTAELSYLVLRAGVKILEQHRADLMYFSLTDYIQHKYAPGAPEADRYYRNMDEKFGRLHDLGAVVALTADHGMNDKANADGSPRVIWLQDVLDARFGKGTSTVICPITDRFVAHHGALGGFVRVYCQGSLEPDDVIRATREIDGIEAVYDRVAAVRRFDLPADREGDVVVISRADTCSGAAAAAHDLSGLAGHRLRTHGGISEARVPFILNYPLRPEYATRAKTGTLESHQIFDFAINGVDPG